MAEWNEGAVVARRGVAAGSALSCCRGQRCRRRPVQVWKVCYIICSQLKNRKKKGRRIAKSVQQEGQKENTNNSDGSMPLQQQHRLQFTA